MTMNFLLDALRPSDWEQVRSIYLEGIASRNATFETEAPTWEKWNAAHLPFGSIVDIPTMPGDAKSSPR